MKIKKLLSLAFTLVLSVILLPTTAYGDVNDIFIYTDPEEGITLRYKVLSENPHEVAVLPFDNDHAQITEELKTRSTITLPSQATNPDNNEVYTVVATAIAYNGRLNAGPFYGFNNLQTVNLPDTLREIGDSTFYNCTSLESVNLVDSIETIASYAFYGCSNLESITLPDNLTDIGASAFEYCEALTSIVLPDNITTIENSTFKDCESLTSIILPDNMTTLKNSAFEGCTGLTSIVLPADLQLIGSGAFSSCTSLNNVIIPPFVTQVEIFAFSNCSNMDTIYFDGPTPSFGMKPFDFTHADLTLYYNPSSAGWDTVTGLPDAELPDIEPAVISTPATPPSNSLEDLFADLTISVGDVLPTSHNGYALQWSYDEEFFSHDLTATKSGLAYLTAKQLIPLTIPEGLFSGIDEDGNPLPTLTAEIAIIGEDGSITDDSSYGSTGGSVKAPTLLEGGKQAISAGSPLTVKTDGRIEEYLYTRINGIIIPEKYLTLKSGSVILTLKSDYTATLEAGDYEISVVSNTGATKTTFTITEEDVVAMEPLDEATKTDEITVKENPATGR